MQKQSPHLNLAAQAVQKILKPVGGKSGGKGLAAGFPSTFPPNARNSGGLSSTKKAQVHFSPNHVSSGRGLTVSPFRTECRRSQPPRPPPPAAEAHPFQSSPLSPQHHPLWRSPPRGLAAQWALAVRGATSPTSSTASWWQLSQMLQAFCPHQPMSVLSPAPRPATPSSLSCLRGGSKGCETEDGED